MSRFGLDYAWGRLSPAQHKVLGSTYAIRYLSYDASKNLTKGEADELRRGGVDIVVVWETTALRATHSEQAGVDDAHAALAQAAACGMPKGRPIYFAVDGNVAPTTVDPYFDGVASVLGQDHCGPYGSYAVCAHLMARGFKYAWQTYAWSGGKVAQGITLYQYSNSHTIYGVGCDYNRTSVADFGQWGYVPPKPVVTQPQGTWAANITAQMEGEGAAWNVESLNGSGVQMGSEDKEYVLKIAVNTHTGQWRWKPEPRDSF